ncbi:MAG TPA: hypothetical protein VHH55_00945 [Gaiellaceae bacterium]|jgi:hypothetical protein|nr:hypothetical protein [Gaiellaceae bacterium]
MATAVRTVVFVALIVGAFAGTAYAGLQMLDTTADPETLREQRLKHQRAYERKTPKGRSAVARRRTAAAAARARAAQRRRAWATRADTLCLETHRDSLALVQRYPTGTPQQTLRFLDAALRDLDRFVVRFRRLGPAPNRPAHARLVREIRASVAADHRLVRSLRARWNPALLAQVVRDDRHDLAIRRLFEQLGSPACADL